MKKKKAQAKQLATIMDYKRTFETEHGKKVLWHMMKVYGFLDRSYVPEDPCGTAFNDGSRNVINNILKKININVQAYEKMLNEHEEEYDVFAE
jgi:hypothetical protein